MATAILLEQDDTVPLVALVRAVVEYCRDNECSVGEGVATLWPGSRLDQATTSELARRGLVAEVHTAMSEDRWRKPHIIAAPPPKLMRTQNPQESPHPRTIPPRVTSFSVLERVTYAGFGGRTLRLSRFTMLDVDTLLAREMGEINGKQRTVDWFQELRAVMVRLGVDRTADIPREEWEPLLRSAPWAND